MKRFRDSFAPTEEELRAWAADPEAVEPEPEWELVLSWGIEPGRLRVVAELAADATLPKSSFFLLVLYMWVSYAARQKDFEILKSQYDRWLNETRGVRHAAVKRWRHRARLIFQGIERFDYDSWWAMWATERESAE